MLGDSSLVEALIKAGCSHKQATAFERCLDDRPIVGVSSSILIQAMAFMTWRDAKIITKMCEEVMMENRRLADQLNDLYKQGKFDFPG